MLVWRPHTDIAALTLQRGGPFPFIWSFPNERGHRDFKSALTNNLDDSFQRLKYVHKRFGVELDATNNPELEGIAVTRCVDFLLTARKGKPQACPQYDRLLAQCCSALGAEQTQSLLQQVTFKKYDTSALGMLNSRARSGQELLCSIQAFPPSHCFQLPCLISGCSSGLHPGRSSDTPNLRHRPLVSSVGEKGRHHRWYGLPLRAPSSGLCCSPCCLCVGGGQHSPYRSGFLCAEESDPWVGCTSELAGLGGWSIRWRTPCRSHLSCNSINHKA
jgi:hypothetical protein